MVRPLTLWSSQAHDLQHSLPMSTCGEKSKAQSTCPCMLHAQHCLDSTMAQVSIDVYSRQASLTSRQV